MCFKTNVPKAPDPTPAPDRGNATQTAQQTRRALAEQQGAYGNIFTSVLGDSSYGRNVAQPKVAALGAGA